jgi:ethanolaminephosphotransferase
MFVYYVIAVLSVLLYLHGFFPIPARPLPQSIRNNNTETSSRYQKAVIIIIDALRLDFISDTTTPFLSKAYKNTGCFIQVKVETPTVTLPRIKALTTGNVPQFVDIIFNLASPTKVEDSFIHRAHVKGKKIVFYGDDIWVKLFPDQFTRSEGTSSFFVNDFTEVDDNVTRNVRLENARNDWDIMILHYLGLDHIGHVYGPKSPLISTKLREMDSIVEEIYKSRGNTLFMITGDHGMRDSGGHGGSTYPETNVPLLVLNMPCVNDTFAQIDIPANLAILLGVDIPATSIGQLQGSLLGHLNLSEFLQALKYNAILLRNKADLCGENIETANHFLDLFLLNNDKGLANDAIRVYQTCAKTISERLLKSSIQQNLDSLIIATLIALIVLLKILQNISAVESASRVHRLEQAAMLGMLVLQFVGLHFYVTLVFIATTLFLFYQNLTCFTAKHVKGVRKSFLTFMSVLHPFIFMSSSFLEEEHQFWYFFSNTFIVFNIFANKLKSWFFLFVALRFVRTINQVGDKWASVPDLADWLLQNDHRFFLQLIFVVGLVLSYRCNSLFTSHRIIKVLDGVILVLIYAYRMVSNESIMLGQVLWLLIFVKFAFVMSNGDGFLPVWILIVNLLLKPHNAILIPVCVLASRLFHGILKTETLVLAHWWLGNLLFFAQGHDNSLASVDISAGYVGLREYEPVIVFPQVLCHTYALPVLSHLLLFTNKQIDVFESLSVFVFFRLYVIVIVFMVTFIQRHHLFVWSVFAPKMFVEASHFGFLVVEVCCYYLRGSINKFCF